MVMKLTGKAKLEQKQLLKEAEELYKFKPVCWELKLANINRKIARLFGKIAIEDTV